jgi:hypothetical protein
MPRIAKPVNEAARKLADEEFYRIHPDRKSKPLTSSRHDAHLVDQWVELYKRHGGKVQLRVPVVAGAGKTTLAACMKSDKKPLEVYVYLVEMTGGDPFGHVGLILQQKDGTYMRYSQAAANPNLHGFDRWQYLPMVSQQEAVVRQHRGKCVKALSVGGRVIRIPTEYPDQVQRAVDGYIADKSHYNIITNDCAEFVSHVLNQAKDISVVGAPLPKVYFHHLENLYPDCVVKS